MSTHDPEGYQKLHDAAAYLQKATGQIITYQQQQKQQDQLRWQRLDQHISMLNQSAQSVAGSANRVVSEAAKGIREQTKEAIAQGVGEDSASSAAPSSRSSKNCGPPLRRPPMREKT